MCGRITLSTTAEIIADVFGLDSVPPLRARYNIAPSQPVAVVRNAGEPPARRLDELRWGLVPAWAKDPAIGNRMINARAETLAEKPAFRSAFRSRRCLVVADGFYEWRRIGKRAQPYLVRRRDRRPFGLAGLWESWHSVDGTTLLTCTIVTTAANPLMAPIHDRMPVLIAARDHATWLGTGADRAELDALLAPCPEEELEAFAVSPHVNDPRNDDEQCVQPLPEKPPGLTSA